MSSTLRISAALLTLIPVGIGCGADSPPYGADDSNVDESDDGSTDDAADDGPGTGDATEDSSDASDGQDASSDDSTSEEGDEDSSGDSDGADSSDAGDAEDESEGSSEDGDDSGSGDSGGADTGGDESDDEGSDGSESDEAGSEDSGDDGGDDECVPPEGPDCTATDVAGKLECIEGLQIVSSQNVSGGTRFDLEIMQPVDHDDPSQGTFTQRLTLLHRAEDLPLVLKTSGYSLTSTNHELASFFQANVLAIEHRYFTPSIPSAPVPWEFLTIEQSADDFHHIYESLKWIYPEKWLNTGASKGGETVVFHRRFHPCDVDGTVAYVAPLVLGLEDQRFVEFLADVGGNSLASCRQALRDLQVELLMRRDTLVNNMTASNYTKFGGPAASYEHSVIELMFGFFQYHSPSECSQVPATNASDTILFNYLSDVGSLSLFADSGIRQYAPYYFQAAAELGVPAGDVAHLEAYLDHLDTYAIDNYLPDGVTTDFDSNAMPNIQSWVEAEGQRLMFVYGEYDPWTAAAYTLGDAEDSYLYTVTAGNHGANIDSLEPEDRTEALEVLARWLESEPIRARATSESLDDGRVGLPPR